MENDAARTTNVKSSATAHDTPVRASTFFRHVVICHSDFAGALVYLFSGSQTRFPLANSHSDV